MCDSRVLPSVDNEKYHSSFLLEFAAGQAAVQAGFIFPGEPNVLVAYTST